MASGDITAVKVLYKQSLGGGQTHGGVKKSSKVLVVGEITATYVSTGISALKVGGDNVFGVSGDVDFVKILPYTINALFPTAGLLFKADYDQVNKLIFLADRIGAADPAIPSNDEVCVLRFIAIGDDADAPELT